MDRRQDESGRHARDLPARHATHFASVAGNADREPTLRPAGGRESMVAPSFEHLGQYGSLVKAMRDELEDFVANHLRRHLAIAERDRYVLTSIHVDSTGADDARRLLERFCREFAPEQIKQYLAKEVIARLPNASAIDLSQFAGLNAGREPGPEAPTDDGFEDLMSELRDAEPAAGKRAYDVTLVGRWSAHDARATSGAPRARLARHADDAARGVALELEVDDGAGRVAPSSPRCRVAITSSAKTRRATSRWRASTRVAATANSGWSTAHGGRSIPARPTGCGRTGGRHRETRVRGTPSDRAVLKCPLAPASCSRRRHAAMRGSTRASCFAPRRAATVRSPAAITARVTPVTPIASPRASGVLALAVRMASGARTIELNEGLAPFRVGRSRSQTLAIDWAHESVSGHHVDIVEADATGAQVVVHGDNGVIVEGTRHAAGARFRWKLGQTMLLGRGDEPGEPACTLVLARDGESQFTMSVLTPREPALPRQRIAHNEPATYTHAAEFATRWSRLDVAVASRAAHGIP